MSALNLFKQTIISSGLLLISAAASAAPIDTLFSTGMSHTGAVLTADSVDPHYEIVDFATEFMNPEFMNLGFTMPGYIPSVPITPLVTDAYENELPNDSKSGWITGSSGDGNPMVTYQTIFDLTGFDLDSVELTLEIAVDDHLLSVIINTLPTENLILDSTANLSTPLRLHNVTIDSGFIEGRNRLLFITERSDGPAGLRVEAMGSDDRVAVPEPGVIALLACGLLGLAINRRFKAW